MSTTVRKISAWTKALCCITLPICFMLACKRESHPTLKETAEWINQTYSPRPGDVWSNNRGIYEEQLLENGAYVTLNRRTTTIHLDGCVVTLEEKQQPNLRLSSEIVTSETQLFNLGDIDPTRIKVEKFASTYAGMVCDADANNPLPCDEAEIGLHTRNEQRTIKTHRITEFPKLIGADHMSTTDSHDDSAYVAVNDLNYVPRLVAAFKRGIELCGGKPSSF